VIQLYATPLTVLEGPTVASVADAKRRVDLWFYNSYKHGSNTNSETDPWSKTEATLKRNR